MEEMRTDGFQKVNQIGESKSIVPLPSSKHDSLKRYFRIYPHVTESHCRRAIHMVGRIYQVLGMKFGFQPEIDDLPCFRKQETETLVKLF